MWRSRSLLLIGEDGGLPSLTCHTDLTACCRSAVENNNMGSLGQWTYPDGSVLLNNPNSMTAGQEFYVLRNTPQLLRLSRREGNNPLTPTRSYCCTVPTTGGEMTLCANLGEWIKLLSLPYFVLFSQYVFTFMSSWNHPSLLAVLYHVHNLYPPYSYTYFSHMFW